MNVFRIDQVRRQLSKAFAGLCMVVAASVLPAAAEVDLTVQKVPTFIGMDLPLRPGERVISTGSGDCSVVAFAPDTARYDLNVSFWKNKTWVGACRFGLAHGKGYAVDLANGSALERTMLYGIDLPAASASQILYWTNDGPYTVRTEIFHSGRAFSDLSRVTYMHHSYDSTQRSRTWEDMAMYWGPDFILQRSTFDTAGREVSMTISSINAAGYCHNVEAAPQPLAKEVKKACGNKAVDKYILIRREGLASDPLETRNVVWVKACPVPRNYSWADCKPLVSEAIGEDLAELNGVIAGDAAARDAAEQEVFARFAPLERALESRLKRAGGARP